MSFDPSRHHRRSVRLPGYDYTQQGYYFVTICTHQRAPLFDEGSYRHIAELQWRALEGAGRRGVYPGRVAIDAWVVMPNHVHGIIAVVPSAPRPIDIGRVAVVSSA